MKTRFLFILIAFLAVNYSYSQEDTLISSEDKYKITKHDGTIFIGYILKSDAREVLIKTDEYGDLYIPKHEIKTMVIYNLEDELVLEKEANRNLLASRYIQTTNGLPIRKGEGYAKFMLLGLDVQFAITDNFSIGGMTSWIGVPLIVTAKYSYSINESVHVSAGILYGNLLYGTSWFNGGGPFSSGGGIGFGNLTFGNTEANVNFSGGYGFIHGRRYVYDPVTGAVSYEMDISGTALFSFAAMKRISKKAMFVFDSIINFNDFSNIIFFTPAIRYLPKPTNIFQFGIGMSIIDQQFIPIPVPMLSFHKIFKGDS